MRDDRRAVRGESVSPNARHVELIRSLRRAVPEVAAALAAILMYARTAGYGFVFDDLSLVGPDGPHRLGNATLPYRPLRYLSYWIDYFVGGGGAWPYHLTNVALHAVVAVVVVRLARRLGAGAIAAGLAGLACAWHPLSIEAVAYVAGRRDLLATLCGLAALLWWMRRDGAGTAPALIFLLAAVAAKESGLLFLPLLLLASALGAGPALGRSSRTLLPVAVAALALPVAYGAVGPLAPTGALREQLSVAGRLATHYALALARPVALSVEYPQLMLADSGRVLGFSARAWTGLGLLASAAALILGQLAAARRPRVAASAAAVIFCALAFIVGRHEPGADRHAYPLLALVCIAAAETAARVSPRARRVAMVVAVALICWFGWLANRRVPVWSDQASLWTATVRDEPGSVRANHNFAGVMIEAGHIATARRALARARRSDPAYAPAYLGQAFIDCSAGREIRGRRWIEKARVRGADPAEIAPIRAICDGTGGP